MDNITTLEITCPDCGLSDCTCDHNPVFPCPIDPRDLEHLWINSAGLTRAALAPLTPQQLTCQAVAYAAYVHDRYGWSEAWTVWLERFERASDQRRGLSPTRLVARATANIPPVAADDADLILEAQRLFFALTEMASKLYEHIQVYQRLPGFLDEPQYQTLRNLLNRVYRLNGRAQQRTDRRRRKALDALRTTSF